MSEARAGDSPDSSMNGGTVELLPLTASDSSDSSEETESRVSADGDSTSSSPLISKTILSRVVLPLVLFALIAGMLLFMQGEYESEEQLEDVEYKNGQIQKIQTDSMQMQHYHNLTNASEIPPAVSNHDPDATILQQQHDHDFNNNASKAPPAVSNHENKTWSRWKQLGNDCDADQRLANTTNLHCGMAKEEENKAWRRRGK